MIHPSLFLRRAILADAIFSGASAVLLTLGAGALAPLLELPEALLRETGLFLIAYATLVGWLGARQAMPKPLVVIVIAGNAGVDACQHRASIVWCGDTEPARRDLCRGAGDRGRRAGRAAIYRPAAEQRRGGGLTSAQALPNIRSCHSGMVRQHQTRNLEIPGSMLRIAPE